MRRPALLGLWVFLAASSAVAADPFELNDGDRVVLVGGTFIEREGNYGHLETILTSRFPDRNVSFRNLGWSGDTVWGEARARFGPPAEGFAHLKTHVEALKPTVILACYGLNESFAGKAGLPAFEKGLARLLDVFDKTGARVVLITPSRFEALDLFSPVRADEKEGRVAKANERLGDYVATIRKAGAARGYRVVDLFATLQWAPTHGPMTDNGIHLNEDGHKEAAGQIAHALRPDPYSENHFIFFADGSEISMKGASPRPAAALDSVKASPKGLSFRATLRRLPARHRSILISVERIGAGDYDLKVDGKLVGMTTAKGEAVHLSVGGGPGSRSNHYEEIAVEGARPEGSPDHAQLARLHAAIVAKNELYFHRWRPQNETYLFGFRKHEQGNNAVEIPRFDPLVAAKEAEIAKLRVPVAHTYEIIRKD